MNNITGRRLTVTSVLTMAALALTSSPAMATPSTPPNVMEQLEQLNTQRESAGVDLSVWTDNPWIWSIIGVIVGVIVLAILIKQGIVGGAEIGFAGNNETKASSGLKTIKNALVGVAVILGSGALSVFVLGLLFLAIF